MAQAKEMLDELKDQAPEADPFPTIRESLAELGANPDKYEKILAKTDEKLHWEKVFRPKTTLEAGAITLLAAAKQSGAEPNEYLSRLAPYFDKRIQSLPDLYNVSGYVHPDTPDRAVLTRTAREEKRSASTLPHELEHTLQNKDTAKRGYEDFEKLNKVKVPGQPNPVLRFGGMDSFKGDLQQRLSELPEEERKLITAKHSVFGDYLSSGNELFARIRAKDMLDSAKGEDFLQTDLGQKLFPTDRDRSYFMGSTLPGVQKATPPYTFESTEQKKKPLTDPKTSYARQLYNKLVAPKEYQEGGEVTDEFPEEAGVMPEQNPSEAAKRLLYYKKTAAPRAAPDTAQPDGVFQPPTVASETERVFGMKPREDRLTILPRYSRETGWVAPEMLYDAARAIAAPGAAARGADVGVPDAVNMAFNVAGGGFGASSAMRNPTGTGGKDLGMFVGQKSNTWDMDKYEQALRFDKLGVDPETTNRVTGYYKNPSSKVWAQEISDHTASMIPDGLPRTLKDSAPITEVLNHTPLFDAYPDLKNITVKRAAGVDAEGAQFDPSINTLFIGDKVTDPKKQLSYMLHELQHWVQTKENFPRGSSPEEIAKIETPEMAKLNERLGQLFYVEERTPKNEKEFTALMAQLKKLKQIQADNSFALYNRVEGEAQARNTQERMWMDEQTRRSLTPLGNFDVPPSEFIQMGEYGQLANTSRVPGAPASIDPPMKMTLPSSTTAKEDLAKVPKAPKAENSESLTKMLEKSVVKEPVYHASKADVKTFSPEYKTELSSMGYHFGTADQANFRTGQYDFSGDNVNIGKYYLDIKNPLETSHMGSFAPDHLADQMMDMGILDPAKYDALASKLDYESVPLGNALVKILKKNGYDGLKYANEREGEGFSFVPFDATQIKSATGNRGTYDPTTPDITKAKGGEVTEFPEEQASPTQQDLSEAAKRLLYYKKTAAPTPPTDLARLGKQAGLIGLGFAPGSGVADYFGKFPAVEGGTEPSAVENFQKGNYGTAALQGLGAMGDLAMAVPVAGAAIGSVMKAPRTAQRILSSSTAAKDDLVKLLGYSEDIPNEKWLAGKVEDAVSGGTNSFGVPRRMGSTTGYFGKPVEVPVEILAKLPGERAEQSNVRKDSLDYIRKNWDTVSKEAPYIEVDPFGKAWVSEGNHRIMVAKEKGLKTLPVEIRYFSGGQRNAGELAPEKILEYNLPSTTTAKDDLAKVPGVLPKAEREANLNKMLEESAVKDRMYHGTTENINEFKPKTGDAVFLTPDPKFANKFAWNDMLYTDSSPNDGFINPSANVLPVYVQVKNPFDYENPKHIRSVLSNLDPKDQKIFKKSAPEGSWKIIENYIGEIQDTGFDSVYLKEMGRKNLAVFDPSKIKSATGNRGTYDTTTPDITKAKGGEVRKPK